MYGGGSIKMKKEEIAYGDNHTDKQDASVC